MTFKPAPTDDGLRALAAMVALLVLAALLVAIVVSSAVSAITFLLLLVALGLLAPAGYLAWRAWACQSLSYWVDRNAVTIVWGPMRQVVPLGKIDHVRRGAPAPPPADWQQRWPRLEKLLLYGPDLGTQRTSAWGVVTSLASRPLPEQLLLQTPDAIFGISPAEPERFLEALAQHHALGPTRLVPLARRLPPVARASLWQDWVGLGLLAAGLAVALILLGILMVRFPALEPSLAQLDGADRNALFLLPAFALGVWLINGLWGLLVYGQQRIAALLLWSGTLAVQAVALIALITLVR